VRLAHLGDGRFFRAHQAWYTAHAPDDDRWGIAAFGGRGGGTTSVLAAQGGLYTLVTRDAEGDRFEVVGSVATAHDAADHHAWLTSAADPGVVAVTVTVTEAGYRRRPDGSLDTADAEVVADAETLRADLRAPVRTAPARLLAAVAVRLRAGHGPVALVPCDNLSGNGATLHGVLGDLASLVGARFAAEVAGAVVTVDTVVDRITPRTEPTDEAAVAVATGWVDRAPVVAEPFAEWVLAGSFPAGRPAWEGSGAVFVDDATPYERRKLRLLNGGHSLLAYAGLARGHGTVADAVADDQCRAWLESWWDEAAPGVGLDDAALAHYRALLLERFSNRRLGHRLDQIAADGSVKLRERVLPVLVGERSSGRPAPGATVAVAAWLCHLRRDPAAVSDPSAGDLVRLADGSLDVAARRVLARLDARLGDDGDLAVAVADAARRLEVGSGGVSA
jgi:fructuronate reductase